MIIVNSNNPINPVFFENIKTKSFNINNSLYAKKLIVVYNKATINCQSP